MELQRYGYIKVSGGQRYTRYEYAITDYGEYDQLRLAIDQHLQAILDKIRSLPGSPVGHRGPLAAVGQLSQL